MSRNPRNVLDQKKSFDLTTWLKEKAPEMKELTLQRVSELASEALGFHVTKANVCGIRDHFDLDLGRHHEAQTPDQAAIVADLQVRLDSLEKWVSVLLKQLASHLQDHGDTGLPPDMNGAHALPSQLSLG